MEYTPSGTISPLQIIRIIVAVKMSDRQMHRPHGSNWFRVVKPSMDMPRLVRDHDVSGLRPPNACNNSSQSDTQTADAPHDRISS